MKIDCHKICIYHGLPLDEIHSVAPVYISHFLIQLPISTLRPESCIKIWALHDPAQRNFLIEMKSLNNYYLITNVKCGYFFLQLLSDRSISK